MKDNKDIERILYLIWVFSLIATLGSLYFSEILKYEPCKLCWIQRILMYPIAINGAIAVIRKDYNYVFYAIPLSVLGILISGYHYGIQKSLFSFGSNDFCGRVSCFGQYVNWFGFISIPLLSLVAFTIITLLGVLLYKRLGDLD